MDEIVITQETARLLMVSGKHCGICKQYRISKKESDYVLDVTDTDDAEYDHLEGVFLASGDTKALEAWEAV